MRRRITGAIAFDRTLTGFRDVLVTKIASTEGAVLYSTYFGGSDDDEAVAPGPDGSALDNTSLTYSSYENAGHANCLSLLT